GGQSKEEPQLDPLPERLGSVREEVVKRAARLLNPLERNPHLAMRTLAPRVDVHESVFNAGQGLMDAQAALIRQEADPGSAEAEALSQAEIGVTLLDKVSAEHGQEAIATNNLFRGITFETQIKGWPLKGKGELKGPMSILNHIVRQEMVELDDKQQPISTPQESFALFAAGVAFLQVTAVQFLSPASIPIGKEEIDANVAKKVKQVRRNIRNHALDYGIGLLHATNQQDLANYLTAQKIFIENNHHFEKKTEKHAGDNEQIQLYSKPQTNA
ncbi:MAG TPA: hypothetical protein VG935_04200, partial [Patescibacteria group bacterium]|nr:hypothetical protein [Patescibacteria group bacterium]